MLRQMSRKCPGTSTKGPCEETGPRKNTGPSKEAGPGKEAGVCSDVCGTLCSIGCT